MSEDLEELEDTLKEGTPLPLYLFWGEEFLIRKAADELTSRLLREEERGLNYAVLDGASPREIAQDLATLPLLPGRKVVLVRDPEFLAPKKGRGDSLKRAKDAWTAGRRREGARRLLAIAARAGWGAGDLDPSSPTAPTADQWKDELNVVLAEADVAFLRDVAAFCREEKLSAPESDATPLLDLFAKGAPEGQVLIIAATEVDPKNPLVKVARDVGRVIERKIAQRLRDLDLSEVVAEALKPFNKTLARDAEEILKHRCGGNVRLLQSELEKLALYSDEPTISASAVKLLVSHSREDEYLELADALQRRDLAAGLRYVEEAIGQGAVPLQLVWGMATMVRNLLLSHDRLTRLCRGVPPRSYDQFQARVFPKIEEEAVAQQLRPPHPYAAFVGIQAAARYSRAELLEVLAACAEADLIIKSSADGKLVLERLLSKTCERAEQRATG